MTTDTRENTTIKYDDTYFTIETYRPLPEGGHEAAGWSGHWSEDDLDSAIAAFNEDQGLTDIGRAAGWKSRLVRKHVKCVVVETYTTEVEAISR